MLIDNVLNARLEASELTSLGNSRTLSDWIPANQP
jgi:hypothetical protein